MSIIFDLDGTLIDSSERMYRLFCRLIPDCKLKKDEYWNYKRNKINHKMLIDFLYPNVCYEEFQENWMSLIECDEFLEMDCNYPDTIYTLREIASFGEKIYLLTARQSRERLFKELERLNLINYFSNIMTTEGKVSKKQLLMDNIKNIWDINNKNYFVSDVGKDIEIGNDLCYYTIAITHGFMSKVKLLEYNSTGIIDELSELLKVLSC